MPSLPGRFVLETQTMQVPGRPSSDEPPKPKPSAMAKHSLEMALDTAEVKLPEDVDPSALLSDIRQQPGIKTATYKRPSHSIVIQGSSEVVETVKVLIDGSIQSRDDILMEQVITGEKFGMIQPLLFQSWEDWSNLVKMSGGTGGLEEVRHMIHM